MAKPTGYILYQGASLIDGAPIVAIAITGKSTNSKTGNMVQTYIIRSDINPVEALKTGDDVSVCGDCKHRPINGGACYVNVGQGVNAVYKAFLKGNYPVATDIESLGLNRMVRLGTYGDPYAVPVDIWEALTSKAKGRTGYTHQWQKNDEQSQKLSRITMASVDSLAEQAIALSKGLRYFRVMHASESKLAKEFTCPASEEGGKRVTCAECGACNGTTKSTGANPVIIVHGAKKSRFIPISLGA